MTKWLLLLPALGLLGGLGVVGLRGLDGRVRRLERPPEVSQREVDALAREVETLQRELAASKGALAALRAEALRSHAVDARLARVEGAVAEATSGVRDHGRELARWEERQRDMVAEVFGEKLRGLGADARAQWRELQTELDTALSLAELNRDSLESLALDAPRDRDAMWRHLMGPAVQIAGESTVGSGVLLASQPSAVEGEWTTLLLTAWHVVRDVLADPTVLDQPVPVRVFSPDGTSRDETASVLRADPRVDLALLRIDSSERHEFGAQLAARERLRDVATFDTVYAVGCPLGNDPIPTCGEVSNTSHEVDGSVYWMISAPTYIGNSGGGVFDAHSHELLGIFSKIYTHGSLRPTVVPHMGLVTPLEVAYDWLAGEGYAEIEPAGGPRATCASAERPAGDERDDRDAQNE